MQAKLSMLGVETFLDERDIEIGDEFEDVIIKELRTSNELIVLLTPWALQRPYVLMEIGAAWALGIRIIGIVYGMSFEDITSNTKNPVLIKKSNLIDLNNFEKYLEQLSNRLNELKSGPL